MKTRRLYIAMTLGLTLLVLGCRTWSPGLICDRFIAESAPGERESFRLKAGAISFQAPPDLTLSREHLAGMLSQLLLQYNRRLPEEVCERELRLSLRIGAAGSQLLPQSSLTILMEVGPEPVQARLYYVEIVPEAYPTEVDLYDALKYCLKQL